MAHVILFVGVTLSTFSADCESASLIEGFDTNALPANMKQKNAEAALVEASLGYGLQVTFGADADWPSVSFAPPNATWDWQTFGTLAVDVHNPGAEPVRLYARVDNEGANGKDHCQTANITVDAGGVATLEVPLRLPASAKFWGMHGVPEYGPLPWNGVAVDPSRITGYQFFLARPQKRHTLVFDKSGYFGMRRSTRTSSFRS